MLALHRQTWTGLLLVAALAGPATAGDAYFFLPVKDLQITEGAIPQPAHSDHSWWRGRFRESDPYALLDGGGEAYVRSPDQFTPWTADGTNRHEITDPVIAIRAPQGADVTGRLFLPKPDHSGMALIKFKVAESRAADSARRDYYVERRFYFQRLLDSNVPGGAWFRYQVRQCNLALDEKPTDGPNRPQFDFTGQMASTYDLFSGGRAISENLQLDRAIFAPKEGEASVDLASLEGITVAAIDWKDKIKDLKPALDPLAAAVPADQHVVFFPSFAKLMEVADNVDEQGTRALQVAAEPRSEDARTQQRYERQLCLSTSALSRLLGPKLVRSVALTGSDPYFMTGTDVAVLFDAKDPDALHSLLSLRIAAGAFGNLGVKAVDGQIGDIAYSGFRSPDRSVCTYLARLGSTIVVTNSPVQLERLVDVFRGKSPAIASLDEYKFFRGRYALGDPDESAFLFLSDATIRRWCGPRWRIANSRRMRGAAVMAELQAEFFEQLASGHVEAGPIHTDLASADLGELRLAKTGVVSSTLGTLDFQTPIVELPLAKVTQTEAEGYKRWRDTYQSNWRWAFDPVGLRIGADPKRLTADLTVMPLIAGSDYRHFVEVTSGAKIKPGAADPHDALIQFVTAVNIHSPTFRQGTNLLTNMMQGTADPLGWLGEWATVYVDDDPFWDELAKQTDPADREKFLFSNLSRMPIAIECEVTSPLRLTAFLVGVRGLIEQTVPGMVVWEPRTYYGQAYVVLGPSEAAKKMEGFPGNEIKELTICYAITPDGLLVTLSETLLKRAIDRQAARRKDKAEGKSPAARPWLGSSVCFQVSPKAIALANGIFDRGLAAEMQARAWNNLPVLNEWHRLYPDRDPVALHEQFWQTRLVCPGGGRYVWNDRLGTMESTVYGSPAEPKPGPDAATLFHGLRGLNFGLTFEAQGLRARVEVERQRKSDR